MSILSKLTHRMSCRDVTRLVSQMQDRPLALSERIRLRLHLLICVACTRFERQMRFMREAMRKYKE
jgi:hypothetical protein